MYQKDFILRMIEMMGELVAAILGLLKKGDVQQAEQKLENAYYDFLKQDAAFFRNIKKEQLTDELINLHNYTNGHLEILAELFYAEAEVRYTKQEWNNSLDFYEKAFILFDYLDKNMKVFSFDKAAKLETIKAKIAELRSSLER